MKKKIGGFYTTEYTMIMDIIFYVALLCEILILFEFMRSSFYSKYQIILTCETDSIFSEHYSAIGNLVQVDSGNCYLNSYNTTLLVASSEVNVNINTGLKDNAGIIMNSMNSRYRRENRFSTRKELQYDDK